MEKRQINQYNMLLAVENHFEENIPIWTTNIPLSDAKTTLSDTINKIETAGAQQRKNSTGVTLDKAEVRADLEKKTFFLSSAIIAYASTHPGYQRLVKLASIAKSDLIKLREADFLMYIENLDEAAMEVIEALGAYKVTQATLTDLMAARDTFRDFIKKPEEVTSSHKDATEVIPVLLHQAMALLDNNIDKLMGLIRDDEPQFVNVYFIDRKIHHIGVRTLSLEITTLNANSNTPLEGAHLEVVGKHIKRISNKSGMNRIQNLVEGNYTLSVNCPNFVPQMIPFTVMTSQTTQLIIQMQSVLEEVTEVQRDKVEEEFGE